MSRDFPSPKLKFWRGVRGEVSFPDKGRLGGVVFYDIINL